MPYSYKHCEARILNELLPCYFLATDIDECSGPESEAASEGNATNGTPCDQICTNVPGSFQCDCEEGYQLSTDGHTCNGEVPLSLSMYISSSG